jgi:hypothetical protein
MLRTIGCVLLALVFVGALVAAEGTVVKLNKDKLVVKFGEKEKTIELFKGIHVHDAEGKEVARKNFEKVLQPGTLIDTEEKDGKVIEINILKKKKK